MTGEWLVGNRAYPDNADIVAVNLRTGATVDVINRSNMSEQLTIPLWTGELGTTQMRVEGDTRIYDQGIGETKPITVRGSADFIALFESREIYARALGNGIYRGYGRQDLHIYNTVTQKVEQTVEGAPCRVAGSEPNSGLDLGFSATFSVVDLNGDMRNDIMFQTWVTYCSLPDGKLFRSDYKFWEHASDPDLAAMMTHITFNSVSAMRLGGSLIVSAAAIPIFDNGPVGYLANHALTAMGLDGKSGDYGLIVSAPVVFPLANVINYEAGRKGIALAGLYVGGQLFGSMADGTTYAIGVAVDGALTFTAAAAGDDWIVAEPGAVVLNGGAGVDTAVLAGSQADWRVGTRSGVVMVANADERHALV